MKKSTLVTMALIAAITTSASSSMAGIASSGTLYMGKVEGVQKAVAVEANLILLQGGEYSEDLVTAMEACRTKQATLIGQEAADNLSDEALLLIISNQ